MEDRIVHILSNLLEKMGAQGAQVSSGSIAGQRVFSVTVSGTVPLTGPRGDIARALDTIVRRIAEREGVEDTHFIVDVNDYRVRQIEEIQQKARMMAERARSFQYDVELTPMNGYERLIVHATLANESDVITESHGDGRGRRVVIRYKSE